MRIHEIPGSRGAEAWVYGNHKGCRFKLRVFFSPGDNRNSRKGRWAVGSPRIDRIAPTGKEAYGTVQAFFPAAPDREYEHVSFMPALYRSFRELWKKKQAATRERAVELRFPIPSERERRRRRSFRSSATAFQRHG